MQWFHRLMGNRFSHEELIDRGRKNSGRKQWDFYFFLICKFGSPPTLQNNRKGPYWVWGRTDADHVSIYRSILEGMACNVRMIVEAVY